MGINKHKPTEEYLDSEIFKALRENKKVKLFLCKDEEGGFGIKINDREVARNQPWEIFEEKFDDMGDSPLA